MYTVVRACLSSSNSICCRSSCQLRWCFRLYERCRLHGARDGDVEYSARTEIYDYDGIGTAIATRQLGEVTDPHPIDLFDSARAIARSGRYAR